MFEINNKLKILSDEALRLCHNEMEKIFDITDYNQRKVLKAFIESKVSESHFIATTGYGYNDVGRDTLDAVYSRVFHSEDAMVRHNFVSGTHAMTVALFGILRPGDSVLSVCGEPYDTIKTVINNGDTGSNIGTLKDFNIHFVYKNFLSNDNIMCNELNHELANNYKMVYIQRSRGYTLRPSLSIENIQNICKIVKKASPDSIILVDNCYGEFVEKLEPTDVGADLVVGSLIKNPGGSVVRTGGYIAGKKQLIELCSYRLTTPGTGKEVGATLGMNREMFMGFFNAPHIVGEALKSAIFTAKIFELLGYKVYPKFDAHRADIVQSIQFDSEGAVISFCKGIQMYSPVDSFVSPEPWNMPGYDNKIIMAAGTFTSGASIELSADAPLREPYAVWVQGGINFYSSKASIIMAINHMMNDGKIKL